MKQTQTQAVASMAQEFPELAGYQVRAKLAKIRRSGLPYRMRLAASLTADNRAGQLHRQLVGGN